MAKPENERREEIARMIDPASWEAHDRWLSGPHAAAMKTEAANEVRPSLETASRILALPSLLQQGDIAQRESGEPVAWWTRGMYGNNQWSDWELISEARAARWRLDPSYKNGRRQVEPLYAAPPAPAEAQARIEALRPISPLSEPRAGCELWQEIDLLFQRYGLSHPPYRLRDELVNHLSWARYGAALDAALASGSTPKPPMTMKVDQDWLRRHTETDPDVDVEAWGSTTKPAGVEEGWVATHRHVKTGGLYRLVSDAVLQTAKPCEDDAYLALYQGADGKFWVRPADEFKDGRFAALTAALPGGSDAKAD